MNATIIMISTMTLMMRLIMTEVMTYKELADRLNIKLASARRLVMRKKWSKNKGNDGETRIIVPLDALQRHDDHRDDSPNDNHDDRHNDSEIKALQAKVDALAEIISAERRRADAAELDRDRWHDLAIRPWWKRLAG